MSAYSHTLSYCWERRPCYSGEYSLRRASQKLCSNSTTDSSVSSPTPPWTLSLLLCSTNITAAEISEHHHACLYWTWVILCGLVDGAGHCHLGQVWAMLSNCKSPLHSQCDDTGQWKCNSKSTPFEGPEPPTANPSSRLSQYFSMTTSEPPADPQSLVLCVHQVQRRILSHRSAQLQVLSHSHVTNLCCIWTMQWMGLENQCTLVESSSQWVSFSSVKSQTVLTTPKLLLTCKILAECFSDLVKNDCRSK